MSLEIMRWVAPVLALLLLCTGQASGEMVAESARAIPVAYDVDVVVVGGSSGGVTAAVEAARQGARVFVAVPQSYVGEDLCATYRLWLEPGEEPKSDLAKQIYAPPKPPLELGNGLEFTYSADQPSSVPHRDSDPPARLHNGKFDNAPKESVQYNGDVNLLLDLGSEKELDTVHVLAYQRPGDFEVKQVAISISPDGQKWSETVTAKNEKLSAGGFEDEALCISADVSGKARYLKVFAQKTTRVERMLLAEIIVEAAGSTKPPKTVASQIPPMPMQVKQTLEQALIDAGVSFLYGCYPTDVLRDAKGNPAGIVMANRSGRQAVIAKVIVDATPRATVARLAGAEFEPYPIGKQTFQRVVLGGQTHECKGSTARTLPSPIQIEQGGLGGQSYQTAIEYNVSVTMPDASFASFAEAEQKARDLTWDIKQLGASDAIFQVPPDPMHGKKHEKGKWPGANTINLDALRPANLQSVYVLGGCADVSRTAAARLLRPLELMELGWRVGASAAADAKKTDKPKSVQVAGSKTSGAVPGEIGEFLNGTRPTQSGLPTIPSEARGIPVLASYDVVVVGGGTGGAPAGIGAARQGAKTLVLEYLSGLGGVGTLGLIGKYYHGHRGGFTAEIDEGVAAMDGVPGPIEPGWNVEWKMEWYRRELRKAGADIWFGVLGCGAVVDKDRVTGVIVATPEGRGVILAKTVIDATGNSDVAAAAGAECMVTGGSNVAVQGTGMPPRKPGASYTNTDYTITDSTDVIDTWRTYVAGRSKYKGAFDLAQIIDSRERRRIVGDYIISPLDIWNGRTFPDTVVFSKSNFDSHGYTIHPFFALKPPHKEDVTANTPYRCLLPKRLDGILVIGLGISAHRDAMPILRMQPDIQNQGYAAGVAAAIVAREGKATRDIDIKVLQKHLVEKGNLPENVLTDTDSYPISIETIEAAVTRAANDYDGVALILAQPDDALPFLRKAYAVLESGETKLIYAHILGMLGDATGAKTLCDTVASLSWDEGWSFSGMGQFGMSLSPLDSLIIALGRTGVKEALPVITEKMATLDATSEFSHHRAVAMALETLKQSEGAKALADLLSKPAMRGYAYLTIENAQRGAENPNPNLNRDQSLRELILARALYRCGDYKGIGQKILKQYEQDLRGHWARHAHAILNGE